MNKLSRATVKSCHTVSLDLQKCAAHEQEDEEAFLEAVTNPAAASPSNQLGIKVKLANDEVWADIVLLQPGQQSAGEAACWQEIMFMQGTGILNAVRCLAGLHFSVEIPGKHECIKQNHCKHDC